MREDAVDSWDFQSSDDELDAELEDGGEGGRDGYEDEVDVGDEHVEVGGVGPDDVEVPEVDKGSDDDEDVDEDNGFFEESVFLFGLVANGPEKLAPEGVEVGLCHEADEFVGGINFLWSSYGAFDGLNFIFAPSLEFDFVVLYFFDGGTQVEQKATFILLAVGEVLDFFLPDQIVESFAVLFVNEGLSSEQDAVAGHHV